MSEKTIHFVLYVNMAIIILGSLVGIYWYFLAERIVPALEFYVDTTAMETDKDTYTSEDTVSVKTSFCKRRSGVGTISWNLVDTYVRTYPTKQGELAKGCYGVPDGLWAKVVDLPPQLPPGEYYLEAVSSVQINPIKNVEYTYKTKTFNVI